MSKEEQDPRLEPKPNTIGREVVPLPAELVVPRTFYPEKGADGSIEYKEFRPVRKAFVQLIEANTPQKEGLIKEITNILMEKDKELPCGVVGFGIAIVSFGFSISKRRRKREILAKVVNELLIKIFDPFLEFKMTKRDIQDTFVANGISPERVSRDQIEVLYVYVLEALKVGKLRNRAWDYDWMLRYIKMKIEEITWSRQKWTLED